MTTSSTANNEGHSSGLTIQDANELRIKVVYAYELKVPLVKTVFGRVLCGIDSGVNAFGRGDGGWRCKREGQLQQLLQQGPSADQHLRHCADAKRRLARRRLEKQLSHPPGR